MSRKRKTSSGRPDEELLGRLEELFQEGNDEGFLELIHERLSGAWPSQWTS